MANSANAIHMDMEGENEREMTSENLGTGHMHQESSSEGEVSSGDAVDGSSGTVAPLERERTAGKIKTVREYWCVRTTRAYPGAEAATKEMASLLEDVWDGRPEVSGPPSEVRVLNKGDERFGVPAATGLVTILRHKFDGWENGSVEKLREKAWAIQASLDECLSVKAFGRVSNHAKEINWLLCAVEGFLESGGALSKEMKDIKVGYTMFKPHVARDNGSEWAGAAFGINITLGELSQVVGWAEGRAKDKAWSLLPELKTEGNGSGRVVSMSLQQGAVGFSFKPADHIIGSAMIFVEGPLEVSDFEIGDSDELPGLEILRCALGEELVIDVEPGARGLAARSIVRVRIKCAIRFEKLLRRKIKKLVRSTADAQKSLAYDTSEGPIDVVFHSAHSLRRMESAEAAGASQGFRGRLATAEREELRRKDALLEELQAHQVKSAEVLDRVINQVEKLAVGQAQAQEFAKQVHASLAAEQAKALNTVNMLAGVFTSYMEREREAPVRLCHGGEPSSSASGRVDRWVLHTELTLEEVGGSGWLSHSQPPCPLIQWRRHGSGIFGARGRLRGAVCRRAIGRRRRPTPGGGGRGEKVEVGATRAGGLNGGLGFKGEAVDVHQQWVGGETTSAKIPLNMHAGEREGWGVLQGKGNFGDERKGIKGETQHSGDGSPRWSSYGLGHKERGFRDGTRLAHSVYEGAAFNAPLRWLLSPAERGEVQTKGGGDKPTNDLNKRTVYESIPQKTRTLRSLVTNVHSTLDQGCWCPQRAQAHSVAIGAQTGTGHPRCEEGNEMGNSGVVPRDGCADRGVGVESVGEGCTVRASGGAAAARLAESWAGGGCRPGPDLACMASEAESFHRGGATKEQEAIQGERLMDGLEPRAAGDEESDGGWQAKEGCGGCACGEGYQSPVRPALVWLGEVRGRETAVSSAWRASRGIKEDGAPEGRRKERDAGCYRWVRGSGDACFIEACSDGGRETAAGVVAEPAMARGGVEECGRLQGAFYETPGDSVPPGIRIRAEGASRSVRTRAGSYSYRQPRASTGLHSIRWGRTGGCTRANGARLGYLDGHPLRRLAKDSKGAERCLKRHRAQSDGAGSSFSGSYIRGAADVAETARGRPRSGQEGGVCVAPVGHRRICSRHGTCAWFEVGVSPGGGSERYRWACALGGMAGEANRDSWQCCGARDSRGSCATVWASRHSHDQPAMRSVVGCEHAPCGVGPKASPDRKGFRGESGAACGGRWSQAKSDRLGVRVGRYQDLHEGALGQTPVQHKLTEGMEMDHTFYLPTRGFGRLDSKATDMGDWSWSREAASSGRRSELSGPAAAVEKEQRGTTARKAGICSRLRLRGGGSSGIRDREGALAGARALTGAGREEAAGTGADDDRRAQGVESTRGETFLGRCLFWNARQLYVPRAVKGRHGREEARVAARKLEFLEHQIDWHAPWIVALLEVAGDVSRLRLLRQWLRKRGYPNMVFAIGEGGGRRDLDVDSERDSLTNGMALAVAKDFAIIASKRLEFRTLAVSLLHKQSQKKVNIVLLHGATMECSVSGNEGEGDRWARPSFSAQLEAATAWSVAHQGVVLMDANRVPCKAWRCPASGSLSKGDLALRRVVGPRCECCQQGRGVGGENSAGMIGEQTAMNGEPIWTRWGSSGEEAGQRSRIDIGIAFGDANEMWVGHEVVKPRLIAGCFDGWVSDHATIVYHLRLRTMICRGESRPLPVNMGTRPRGSTKVAERGSAWVRMAELTGKRDFLDDIDRACRTAARENRSQVQEMVPLIRGAGEAAVKVAKEGKQTGKPAAESSRRPFDDRSEVASWNVRLKVAQECAKGARELDLKARLLLFHEKTGLRRWSPHLGTVNVGETAWRAIIKRCRRQLSRAEAGLNRRRAADDSWLAKKCKQIDEQAGGGELTAHMRTIWRMIRKQGGSSEAMHVLHRGDKREAPTMEADDPEFLAEAGRIGEAFVQSMDKGAIPSAFSAWLHVFCTRQDELKGSSGMWQLRREFSYELFERVLVSMQGKAVGAGGLSVELLIAASHEVRWRFYKAIMDDVESGHIAPSWRRVIYVLLRKPPPNDAAIVAQRREIALMPQDLKILLQGVRIMAYEKISAKLEAAQFGWRKGVGCADPGIALACVLDQARRLQHSAWILYVDLANFFPAINRVIAHECESFMGLPEEVSRIMAQIYGGQMGEPTRVACQYETGIGLGAPFANHMGRLMGCPVSPDSAKILLNSVITAIRASTHGIKLWPFKGEEVCQLAYADDWVGLFDDVEQLKKTLAIWLVWAEVVGARLGIKGLVKTVVTGVMYKEGKACTPDDPGLTDLDGTPVPLLPCDELYKHLGVPRAANADAHLTWVGRKGVPGILDKLRTGLRRIGRLKPGCTSPEQFICISNVILGGLGGFYLQSAVASEAELEQVEREWRRYFNRFARRDHSSHAINLYTPSAAWKKGRTHLLRTGMAAVYSTVGKLLADSDASPARAAARSAVALAMYYWGCRSSPNRWRWEHLKADLQRSVYRKGARYIGDAWLLACAMLEEDREPGEAREFMAERRRIDKWGRWRGWEGSEGTGAGPLSANESWFKETSQPLFEPRDRGGRGLALRPLLQQAGIVELNQLCATPFVGASGRGRWLLDRRMIAVRVRRKVTAALWKQWESAVRTLQSRRVSPVRQEDVSGAALRHYPAGKPRKRKGGGSSELWALAKEMRRRRIAKEQWESADEYVEEFRRWLRTGEGARPDVERGRVGESTMICHCLNGAESEVVVQWGDNSRGDSPFAAEEGWATEAHAWTEKIRWRQGDGWPIWNGAGREVEEPQLGDFPPALQLVLRARIALGRGAAVVGKGWGEKLHGIRVAEDVQQANWAGIAALQARFQFTHAMAVDASEGEMTDAHGEMMHDEWGWVKRRTAAAVVSHDGAIGGGCLTEDTTSNSYVGELSALVAGLDGAPAGSRVLMVIDSTSPVKAWLRFRWQGDRARRQYNAAALLASLGAAVNKHKLVYFLWQRSHCGSPVNEWADVVAERFRRLGSPSLQVEKEGALAVALWPARVQGSLFTWALEAGTRAAHKGMLTRLGKEDISPAEDDVDIGILRGEVGAAASLLRDNRLMVADLGHVIGRRERDKAGRANCPLGCGAQGCTWLHYAFECNNRLLVEERMRWAERIRSDWDKFDRRRQHSQVTDVMAMLVGGPEEGRGRSKEASASVRRLLSGFVSAKGLDSGCGDEAMEAIRRVVVGGIKLLCVATRLEDGVRAEVELDIQRHSLLLKVIRCWRRKVTESGPNRVDALRQLRLIRLSINTTRDGCRREGRGIGAGRDMLLKWAEAAGRAARFEIEESLPEKSEVAVVMWYIQMRWWGRWAARPDKRKVARWTGWSTSAGRAMDIVDRIRGGAVQLELRWGGLRQTPGVRRQAAGQGWQMERAGGTGRTRCSMWREDTHAPAGRFTASAVIASYEGWWPKCARRAETEDGM